MTPPSDHATVPSTQNKASSSAGATKISFRDSNLRTLSPLEAAVTRNQSDVDAVTYELNRLEEFLVQYEKTPGFREQVVKLIDYAAWEQLSTSLRGLRQTVRNLGSQVRGPRLPQEGDE